VPVPAQENVNTFGRPRAIVEERCVGAEDVAIIDDVGVLVEAPPGMRVLSIVDAIGDLGTVLGVATGHAKEEDAAEDVVEEDAEDAADDASLTIGRVKSTTSEARRASTVASFRGVNAGRRRAGGAGNPGRGQRSLTTRAWSIQA